MKIMTTTRLTFSAVLMALLSGAACAEEATGETSTMSDNPEWNSLSEHERRIIEDGGTERPFTGEFVDHKADGIYTCARCGTQLFNSDTKFDSGSGWPSFDDAIEGAVRELADADGRRTEIRCGTCDGHLGHVFRGEGMTPRNTRHCVNSASLDFVGAGEEAYAYFAGGCFWGVEHLLQEMDGVSTVESGYMGGHVDDPTYQQVCSGRTGHAEVVKVTYNPFEVNYRALAKRFLEIHDPSQMNRQGPDIGTQYRSAIFTSTDSEREAVQELFGLLEARGYSIATTIEPHATFWPAEEYHQDYYEKSGRTPYCHAPVNRFGDW